MRLSIKAVYGSEFIKYILSYIKNKIIKDINISKLLVFEVYINSLPKYQTSLKKNISAYEVCIVGANNLVVHDFNNEYIIEIDSVAKFPGALFNLLDLCKLINYGVVGLQAYPIFSDTFNYVKNNINILYDKYIEEIGK